MFIFLLLLLLQWNTAGAQPLVDAPAAILMDGNSGQVLFEKSADLRCYPASITKILTALIFVENVALDQVLEVGQDVPNQIEVGSSQIYLLPGEKLTAEQLLNALLVESANDAAVVMAEHISGSVPAFAEIMNQRAKELGALDSHFVNPHGLHDEQHYTTARDMALILKEVLKHPILTEIMHRRNYVIPSTGLQDTRYLWTKNKLFQTTAGVYYNENVIASKTGYTNQAGNTLVSAAKKEDLTLITVVLQCVGYMTYESTNALFNYGFSSFSPLILLKEQQVVESIQVGKQTLDLVAAQTLHYAKPLSQQGDVEQQVEIPEELDLPLDKGAQVGNVIYRIGDTEIGRTGLLAAEAVTAPFQLGIFLRNALFFLIALLFIAYVVLRIYVMQVNRKIRKRKLAKKRRSEYAKF
jgi:D-alanyl-D-alanine carboxypeptidase (penicillin-binding protein 5/6)